MVNLHTSHHGLGGYSKLINGLRAAASCAFVCWRPNLQFTCKMCCKRPGCCPLMYDSSFFHSFIHSWSNARYYRRSRVFRSPNTLKTPKNETVYLIISSTDIFKTNRNLLKISSLAKKSEKKNDACSAGYFIFSFPFQFNRIYFTLEIFL